LIPHYESMKNIAGSVSFLNAQFGLKTSGKKEWQRIYNYPEIGIGLSHTYLTKRFLGNPTAIYSFMNIPLNPDSKLKLNLGMYLGFAWGFKPTSDLNLDNVVIGSKCSAYGAINLNTSFKISPDFEILLSGGGYHYSNGNTRRPNKGINMLGAEAGIRYYLPGSNSEINIDEVTPIHRSSSVMTFGSLGWKKEATHTPVYRVGSWSTGYYRTMSHKTRWGAGIDIFYDEDVLYYTQREKRLQDVIAAGIFAGHELTFNHLSIVTQVGIYLRNPNPNDPFHYERLGFRYIIAKRIVPSLSLKSHAFKVDFIEWGLGYVLWKSS